jgi:hypothetical protein
MEVIEFARSNNNQTAKKQACYLIPYYYNTQKHVGDNLTRMVKSNMLKRMKNGLYELSNGQKEIVNQSQMFNSK